MTISFLTLFLGLVSGSQPVRLEVTGSAATVTLELDGEVVAELREEPWEGRIDFGALAPHRLEAIARGASGVELARTHQLVNLPRPAVEVQIAFDPDGRQARVSWESQAGPRPLDWSIELDGTQLEVPDPALVPLPELDRRGLHYLRVELSFAQGLQGLAEATLGGQFVDSVDTELTAVPIESTGRRAPDRRKLEHAVLVDGRPAAVVAVEEGPAELLLVASRKALAEVGQALQRMAWKPGAALRAGGGGRSSGPGVSVVMRRLWTQTTLPADVRTSLLSPVPEQRMGAASAFRVFPVAATLDVANAGLPWLLERVEPWQGAERLADAVAVAGVSAAARKRRRAVVLLIDGESPDASASTPRAVEAYLASIHVPFAVWATSGDGRGWSDAVSIGRLDQLGEAMVELRGRLDRQRVVMVEGTLLPQQLSLAASAERLVISR